jgi:acyl-CoA synthetase (AMP-forming)/AMP-acid ligase II
MAVPIEPTVTPETIAKYRAAGSWSDQSLLTAFTAAVESTPEKTATVDPDGSRRSYAEVDRASSALAGSLSARGVSAGDVISVQLPNCGELLIVHIAALKLGAVTNPLLTNYRAKELSYILGFAGTKAVIIPDQYRRHDYVEMFEGLRADLPALEVIAVVGDTRAPAEGMAALADLIAQGDGSDLPAPPDDCNAVTLLAFTSGTESKPKGVVHSENTMMYGTHAMRDLIGLTSDDVIWGPSPLSHGTGFQWGLRMAVTLGATLVIQDIWDPVEAIRMIEREKCTFSLAATPFAAMMLECPEIDQHDLSSFRIFGCAGAAIPEKLGQSFREKTGCTLIGMWGMTECFVGTASSPDAPEAKLWLTDGQPMPGAEAAIFDETRSTILKPGETGELASRGPHVALGYFNDPERTSETFREDGWLFSGDLATIDEQGYVKLIGRKKEIINRGGLKISVREVEEMLLAHGAFSMVALVAVPDPRLGEKGCLFVVPRPGQSSSLADVVGYLESRGVAKYKLPEFYVALPEFPMTASGKIQKFQLRDEFLAGKHADATDGRSAAPKFQKQES